MVEAVANNYLVPPGTVLLDNDEMGCCVVSVCSACQGEKKQNKSPFFCDHGFAAVDPTFIRPNPTPPVNPTPPLVDAVEIPLERKEAAAEITEIPIAFTGFSGHVEEPLPSASASASVPQKKSSFFGPSCCTVL